MMVNLTEREDVGVLRPVVDGGFRPRSHRNWGARLGRHERR